MTSVTANKQQIPAAPSPPTVAVSGDGGDCLALAGTLEIVTLPEAKNSLKKWSNQGSSRTLDIAMLGGLDLKPLPKAESVPQWRQIIIQLGKGAHDARHETLDIITFVGRAASWTVAARRRRQRSLRWSVQGADLCFLHRHRRLHARATGERFGGECQPGDHPCRGEIDFFGARA